MKINKAFVDRNIVAIVMIPAIIAFHISWSVLQSNRKANGQATIAPEQPIISIFRMVKENLKKTETTDTLSTAPTITKPN